MSAYPSTATAFFPERELVREIIAKIKHYGVDGVATKVIDDLRCRGEFGTKKLTDVVEQLPPEKQQAVMFILAAGTSELAMSLVAVAEHFVE